MSSDLKPVVQTLCIVERDGQVLLGLKGRKMGAGRRSNPGGNVEEGEDIEMAAKREVLEETGIVVEAMEPAGVIDFEMPHKGIRITMHIFKVMRFTGEPKETEEMRDLRWYPREQQPIKEMWPDDEFWVPHYLQGKEFRGKFVLGEGEAVISHEFSLVDGNDEMKVR